MKRRPLGRVACGPRTTEAQRARQRAAALGAVAGVTIAAGDSGVRTGRATSPSTRLRHGNAEKPGYICPVDPPSLSQAEVNEFQATILTPTPKALIGVASTINYCRWTIYQKFICSQPL